MNKEFEERGYKLIELNLGYENLIAKSFEECVRAYNFLPAQDAVVSCKSIDITMESLGHRPLPLLCQKCQARPVKHGESATEATSERTSLHSSIAHTN